jgi:hypothetical protein
VPVKFRPRIVGDITGRHRDGFDPTLATCVRYVDRVLGKGSRRISGPTCRGMSQRFIRISKCSTNRTQRPRRSLAHAKSRAQTDCATFTLETCTIGMVAALGVPVVMRCLSSAIGTS